MPLMPAPPPTIPLAHPPSVHLAECWECPPQPKISSQLPGENSRLKRSPEMGVSKGKSSTLQFCWYNVKPFRKELKARYEGGNVKAPGGRCRCLGGWGEDRACPRWLPQPTDRHLFSQQDQTSSYQLYCLNPLKISFLPLLIHPFSSFHLGALNHL